MNPRNVMGVLVPREFFTSDRNTGFNVAAEVNHGSAAERTAMWYRMIAPQNTRVYSSNLRSITDITQTRLNPQQYQANLSDGQWNIMASISNNLRNVNVYENRVYNCYLGWCETDGNRRAQYYSFMRYTNESDVSIVWAIRVKYNRSVSFRGNPTYSENFEQQCMTYDCRANPGSNSVSFNSFGTGPRIEYGWSPSISGTFDSSYTMTVDGTRIQVR